MEVCIYLKDMRTIIWQFILLSGILLLSISIVSAQQQVTRDNYTGDWQTPTSWSPTWTTPQTNISKLDITINGYITLNGSLSFSGNGDNLIINDTLVIIGDLSFANKDNLTINDNGILIIRGNMTINNQCDIKANAYLIVTGDFIQNGSVNQGSLISNDNPEKVFIGGNISPLDLTNNNPDFPALNCSTPTTPYPNSTCSYGNLDDLANDPIYPFFQSTCSATPTITTSGPTTFCYGESVVLTSSTGSSYVWSTGAGSQSISVTEPGNYTVQITGPTGCLSAPSQPILVIVNPLPIVDAGTDNTIPGGTSTLINATVTGYGPFTYSWTPATQLLDALIEDPTTVNLASTTVFTLTATSIITSCSNSSTVTITTSGGVLSSKPTATPGIVCVGLDVQLRAMASGGSGNYSYSWTSVPAGFTSDIANPVVNPVVDMTYYVTVSDGPTSVGSSVNVPVIASPPVPSVMASGPATFCYGGSVTLNSSAGANYLWSNLETSSSINVSASGSYSVIVIDEEGCRSLPSTPILITVNPLPIATTGNNGPVCAGNALNLAGGADGMTSYSWTGINGFTSLLQNPAISANAESSMAGNYTLTVTDANGCSNEAETTVLVNDMPIVNAGPDQELELVYEALLNAEIFSSETGEWSIIKGSGIISNINSPSTLVTGLSAGENIFQWSLSNGNCNASDEVNIRVNDIFVPSVITPNEDGKNDYFKINFTGSAELIILNRWGNEEYANSNYLNDWNGKNNKGQDLPNDTYFYILKFENGNIKKGSVLIKK
jgi:gliding motility-associated-like protein